MAGEAVQLIDIHLLLRRAGEHLGRLSDLVEHYQQRAGGWDQLDRLAGAATELSGALARAIRALRRYLRPELTSADLVGTGEQARSARRWLVTLANRLPRLERDVRRALLWADEYAVEPATDQGWDTPLWRLADSLSLAEGLAAELAIRQSLPEEPSVARKFYAVGARQLASVVGTLGVVRDGLDVLAGGDGLADAPELPPLAARLLLGIGDALQALQAGYETVFDLLTDSPAETARAGGVGSELGEPASSDADAAMDEVIRVLAELLAQTTELADLLPVDWYAAEGPLPAGQDTAAPDARFGAPTPDQAAGRFLATWTGLGVLHAGLRRLRGELRAQLGQLSPSSPDWEQLSGRLEQLDSAAAQLARFTDALRRYAPVLAGHLAAASAEVGSELILATGPWWAVIDAAADIVASLSSGPWSLAELTAAADDLSAAAGSYLVLDSFAPTLAALADGQRPPAGAAAQLWARAVAASLVEAARAAAELAGGDVAAVAGVAETAASISDALAALAAALEADRVTILATPGAGDALSQLATEVAALFGQLTMLRQRQDTLGDLLGRPSADRNAADAVVGDVQQEAGRLRGMLGEILRSAAEAGLSTPSPAVDEPLPWGGPAGRPGRAGLSSDQLRLAVEVVRRDSSGTPTVLRIRPPDHAITAEDEAFYAALVVEPGTVVIDVHGRDGVGYLGDRPITAPSLDEVLEVLGVGDRTRVLLGCQLDTGPGGLAYGLAARRPGLPVVGATRTVWVDSRSGIALAAEASVTGDGRLIIARLGQFRRTTVDATGHVHIEPVGPVLPVGADLEAALAHGQWSPRAAQPPNEPRPPRAPGWLPSAVGWLGRDAATGLDQWGPVRVGGADVLIRGRLPRAGGFALYVVEDYAPAGRGAASTGQRRRHPLSDPRPGRCGAAGAHPADRAGHRPERRRAAPGRCVLAAVGVAGGSGKVLPGHRSRGAGLAARRRPADHDAGVAGQPGPVRTAGSGNAAGGPATMGSGRSRRVPGRCPSRTGCRSASNGGREPACRNGG